MGAARKVSSPIKGWARLVLFAGLPAFLIIALSTFGASGRVYAADMRQKLVISPVANDISLNPGESYTGTMTVVNQSASTMSMQAYVSPYFVTGEQYSPVFTHVDAAVRADTWVRVTPSSADIQPQGVTTVGYTVSVPANARPGGYYAVVFAQAAGGNSGSVALSERAGEILYLTVKGPATTGGTVNLTPVSGLAFNATIKPNIAVHNTGSTHFIADATWRATPLFGGSVDTIQQSAHILPGTTRLVPATITLQPRFGIGIYTINRSVTYVGAPAHSSQLVVVVSPVWPALIGIGVVMFSLIRYTHGRKARGRHV